MQARKLNETDSFTLNEDILLPEIIACKDPIIVQSFEPNTNQHIYFSYSLQPNNSGSSPRIAEQNPICISGKGGYLHITSEATEVGKIGGNIKINKQDQGKNNILIDLADPIYKHKDTLIIEADPPSTAG